MRRNVKHGLFALVLIMVALVIAASVIGTGGGSPDGNPKADDGAAASKPQTAAISYSVGTAGAPTDGWPLYLASSGADIQISPAGGSLDHSLGSYSYAFANDYWIASDGTLLKSGSSEGTSGTLGEDGAEMSFQLERVDPATTSYEDYQAGIDDAVSYLAGRVGESRAEELKQLATAIAPNAPPAGTLAVHYLDVGQGDSELVMLPDGRNMLIDAGTSDAGSAVVSSLRSLGVTRIDYLVATHPHADHIGGMAQVIRSFDIGEGWAPEATANTAAFESFASAVQSKGLSIEAGSKDRSIVPAGSASYSIDILGPSASVSSDDLNDYSLIIQVKFGSTSFLFTGDAPKDEIRADVSGHVDVLKVAHHGSDTGTDTALMQQLTPTIAVISYGLDNSYGHPTQDTLDALSAVSAHVFGTGANGSVTVTSDGATVSVSPEREGTVVAESHSACSGSSSSGKSVAAQAAPAAQDSAPASDAAEETVYVTPHGEKYHRQGCRYLAKSGGGTAISKPDAIAQGYEPCKVCNP